MYKVQDVKLTATLMERIFKLETVTCYTGDVTNPQLMLVHIKNSKEIKNYLLKACEDQAPHLKHAEHRCGGTGGDHGCPGVTR